MDNPIMGNILAGQGADDMTCAIQMIMPSMAVMVGVPGQAFFGTMRVHNKQNTCSHAGHVVHYIYIYIYHSWSAVVAVVW